jgi:predicted enzyme involved in methoxymalonyl-ACP biosynthesis
MQKNEAYWIIMYFSLVYQTEIGFQVRICSWKIRKPISVGYIFSMEHKKLLVLDLDETLLYASLEFQEPCVKV